MDMRDPWTSNYMVQELMKRSAWADRIDQGLEDKALATADCVTGISPGLLSEYSDRANRTELIFNGFDAEDFPDFEKTGPDEHFIFSYIGSVKPNQNITALWEAIAELNDSSPEFKKDFRLRFVGNLNPSIMDAIKKLGISDQLIQVNFIPHSEAIHLMQSTSLLLFIVPRATYAKKITSGKIFEYMASKTPMLSLGPVDGDAAWIVDKAKRDEMIDYDDKESIKEFLNDKFLQWKANGRTLPRYKTEDHMIFSRKNLTGQLAEVLNAVSSKKE
jgi:glycosyltransferase involved in cell wall biosynthesis